MKINTLYQNYFIIKNYYGMKKLKNLKLSHDNNKYHVDIH